MEDEAFFSTELLSEIQSYSVRTRIIVILKIITFLLTKDGRFLFKAAFKRRRFLAFK